MIPVCSLAEIPPGESVRVLAPHPVAIFNVDGDLYAIDDTCTHQDASLSDGWVEGCLVECPLHAAMFDLRTGIPTGLPARRPVRTWAVVLVDDVVHLDAARVGAEVREHAA
ncbi:bifunctional 3-phenylpropionate/cinnamic acid dioxygenase ferredoxin subunit [Actinoalloteichus hymeniacidonis]|uniref:bifunctional 3-phenylpropionate/cinnamic acid dioxygenase ferredoxin subunit n=1 Tax=Actinoalloteichus hymeniacidonis TaxID=340345 RepID=UPI0008530C44|nr:bifunctional 3-phenylpropionate/cinnamic acid dioxygenase ferredoxin subunit [Actinoalloteichus hymeniacidonis]